MHRVGLAIGLLLCAACGGGGGGGGGTSGGGGIDPRLARLDIYEAQKLRILGDPGAGVMGMPVTSDENLPTDGNISFAGSASLRVEVGAQPIVVFGDARLRVDFDDGFALGAIENAFGTTVGGAVVNYGGVIDLASDDPGQNMPITYDGVFTASDQTLTLSGTMNGVLLGNPVGALVASDLEAEVEYDGTTEDATFVMTLEGAADPN